MAVANAVPTIKYSSGGDGQYQVIGTLAIDANPATYQAGGIPLNFFTAPLIKASRVPLYVQVSGIAGYIYSYVNGADASAGLLKIFVQDAVATNPLLQIAVAAIPAGVSGDTITFEAAWLGME